MPLNIFKVFILRIWQLTGICLKCCAQKRLKSKFLYTYPCHTYPQNQNIHSFHTDRTLLNSLLSYKTQNIISICCILSYLKADHFESTHKPRTNPKVEHEYKKAHSITQTLKNNFQILPLFILHRILHSTLRTLSETLVWNTHLLSFKLKIRIYPRAER